LSVNLSNFRAKFHVIISLTNFTAGFAPAKVALAEPNNNHTYVSKKRYLSKVSNDHSNDHKKAGSACGAT